MCIMEDYISSNPQPQIVFGFPYVQICMIYSYPLLPSIYVSCMGMMVVLNHEIIPACNTHADHTPQWHACNKYTINEACTNCTHLHRELQTATETVSP